MIKMISALGSGLLLSAVLVVAPVSGGQSIPAPDSMTYSATTPACNVSLTALAKSTPASTTATVHSSSFNVTGCYRTQQRALAAALGNTSLLKLTNNQVNTRGFDPNTIARPANTAAASTVLLSTMYNDWEYQCAGIPGQSQACINWFASPCWGGFSGADYAIGDMGNVAGQNWDAIVSSAQSYPGGNCQDNTFYEAYNEGVGRQIDCGYALGGCYTSIVTQGLNDNTRSQDWY